MVAVERSERYQFLSAEWLRAAFGVAGAIDLASTSSCRLQFDAGGVRCFLVVENGRVTDWDLGTVADPDVALRWPLDTAWQIATNEVQGNEAVAVTSVTAVLGDGIYVGLPAPMGLWGRPELDAMPALPDATLTVHHQLWNGPFGEMDYLVDFVDGRVIGERLGPPDVPPDVFVAVSYRTLALVRARQRTTLEALEGGRIDGHVSSLAALAALYETPAFEDAMFATGRHGLALATLGELRADDGFRTRMAALLRNTARPDAG